MNVWDISPHQLDVIRTLFAGIGALGGLAGGVAAIFSYLSRKWARQAANNTSSRLWVDGKLHDIPVSEHARHAAIIGEANRQETADLSEWVRGSGRRRLDTTDMPRLPPEESSYS